jgi:hypothetical protein
VRIEQQLTQGDENDGADDRRRSMCGTSNAAQVQEALKSSYSSGSAHSFYNRRQVENPLKITVHPDGPL